MISKLKIENFKCFSSPTEIELSGLTACVGMNSMGKSSFIQALLLLRQAYEVITKFRGTRRKSFEIFLNDRYALQLGTFDQVMSSTDADSIIIQADDVVFNLKQSSSNQSLTFQINEKLETIESNMSIFSSDFYYLNAERIGPRNYQAMESNSQLNCGFFGEQTYFFLSQNNSMTISSKRCFPNDEGKNVKKLDKQLEYWLNFIVPGVEIHISEDSSMRLSQVKIGQPQFDTGLQSPYNFGFGISYVLPIIATGLAATNGSMVIFENPEAHLHPAGQSRIGQFLACIANDGLQVVVETHSEHVINGIRLYSLKNNMDPKSICINYFNYSEGSKEYRIKRIKLNEQMKILEWPDGFFDQEEKDLKELRLTRGRQQ